MKFMIISQALLALFVSTHALCMDDIELGQKQNALVPGLYQQVANDAPIAPQLLAHPAVVAVRIPLAHAPRLGSLLRPAREEILEKQHAIFEEHKLMITSNGMSKIFFTIAALAAANGTKDIVISCLKQGSDYYYPLAALASTLMCSGSTMCTHKKHKEKRGHMRSLTNLIDQRNHLVVLGDTINKKCERLYNISELVGREKSDLYGGLTAVMCLVLLCFKDAALCFSDTSYGGTIDMYSFWANMLGIMCMITIAVESCEQSKELEFTNLKAELDQLILNANEQ